MRMMAIWFLILCLAMPYARAHDHGEQCIQGKYHKKSPSTETKNYHHCQPWKNLTCCTAEFTKELVMNETRTLYNHSWHRCGQLSAKCLQFWFEQVQVCHRFFFENDIVFHGFTPTKDYSPKCHFQNSSHYAGCTTYNQFIKHLRSIPFCICNHTTLI